MSVACVRAEGDRVLVDVQSYAETEGISNVAEYLSQLNLRTILSELWRHYKLYSPCRRQMAM